MQLKPVGFIALLDGDLRWGNLEGTKALRFDAPKVKSTARSEAEVVSRRVEVPKLPIRICSRKAMGDQTTPVIKVELGCQGPNGDRERDNDLSVEVGSSAAEQMTTLIAVKSSTRALENLPMTHVHPEIVLAYDGRVASPQSGTACCRHWFANLDARLTELQTEPSSPRGQRTPCGQARQATEGALEGG